MKWRTKAALTALTIIATAFLVLWPGDREPRYNGKPLSHWVLLSRHGIVPDDLELQRLHAIEAIGSNAAPFLLKWINYESGPWRNRVIRVAPRVTLLYSREDLANASVGAFQIIGPGGQSALPGLAELMRCNSVIVASRALRSMEAIGEPSVPALLDVVTNRPAYNRDRRLCPFQGMDRLRQYAPSIVPVLTRSLRDQEPEVAVTAAAVLGAVGPEPGVVNALTNILNAPHPDLRASAIFSLSRFGPDSIPVVPCLVRALSDPDPIVREAATNSLRTLGDSTMGIVKPP